MIDQEEYYLIDQEEYYLIDQEEYYFYFLRDKPYYFKGIKFRGYLISRFFSFDNSRVLNFAILSC